MRRGLVVLAALSPFAGAMSVAGRPEGQDAPASSSRLCDEVAGKVLPEKGFQSRVRLDASVVRLVENNVIVPEKFTALYENRGGLPPELQGVLSAPAEKPILLTRVNARYYVNLLWPLGLSNHMSTNDESPVNGKSLFKLASTGGWNMGKEKNGGAYFNKFRIVALTPEQERLVTTIARSTYRPCCDNSTFFQDCDHGSALLGLLALGASQGLTKEDLYREALAFNSFWFPRNYVYTALYFKAVKNTDWENVDAGTVMGFEYSALGPWSKNVEAEIVKIPNLLPQTRDSAACAA